MRWRTGPEGYGLVSKALHWLTVALVAGQFTVGWSMDLDEACDPPGEGRSGGDTSDRFEERLDRIEEACEADADRLDLWTGGFDLPELHLILGSSILLMAALRIVWRRYDGFPPWSDALSALDQRLVHVTERVLLLLLWLVPLSGLLLLATGSDAWLPLHVASHVAFFVALAAHLFTNLRPRVLRRML